MKIQLVATLLLTSLLSTPFTSFSNVSASEVCNEVLGQHFTVEQAWNQSAAALVGINQKVYGREAVIEAMTTAILAREFVWMNGEPGGAKTFLSRIMFQSVLKSVPEQDKKIFVLQFHKLISEGKITGFQKFNAMMKDGKYEIETSSSLVGEQYLYLIADEAEKSNPAVLNALLAVLNERKAFLGARVVDAILASGVFTSNKTTGEFIQGFLSDRPSGEALLDRMAIKIHILNQQVDAQAAIAMYDLVKSSSKGDFVLPLQTLEPLLKKVQISDAMMQKIVRIAREFDRYVVQKADNSRSEVRYGKADSEYFPANQFSNRSVRRLVQIFKAAFLSKQLTLRVPFAEMRLTAEEKDLSLLSRSALYMGIADIRLKRYPLTTAQDQIKVNSPYGVNAHFDAVYSPYEKVVYLTDNAGNHAMTYREVNGTLELSETNSRFTGWTVEAASLSSLEPLMKTAIETNAIDIKVPQFEVETNIDDVMAKGTFKSRTQNELQSIRADMDQFATVLNQVMTTEIKPLPAKASLTVGKTVGALRADRRDLQKKPKAEQLAQIYDQVVFEAKLLKERFVELDHSVEAHLTALLSENHLYVFGPPGGAKTALAEAILKSELGQINHSEINTFVEKILANKANSAFVKVALQQLRKEAPKEFERFLLQFHKLLPEGVLVGFPKIEKQLNEGIEEIDVSTSLASQKFVFAILDEVDKANPQTITALLSILNEREVFAGNQVIKTALRTAVLTSNKMPSEFLDSYYEDRSAGEALMDRAINKVYVSNKIASEDELTHFLLNLEKGNSFGWKGILGVSDLKPVMQEVQFAGEETDIGGKMVKELIATIHQRFLAARIKVEEESILAHKMDPREFPDYYISAAGSASDRTLIKLLDQMKARVIIHQAMNGVPYANLKKLIEVSDIGLFFEGLGYWAPQTISHHYAEDGIIEFTADSTTLNNLIQSGIVDSRTRYQLEAMISEAKDFVDIANSTIRTFMTQYRDEIAKYPNLFPGAYKENP